MMLKAPVPFDPDALAPPPATIAQLRAAAETARETNREIARRDGHTLSAEYVFGRQLAAVLDALADQREAAK